MDRTLRDDWFATVRRTQQADNRTALFDQFRRVAAEIASAKEAQNVKSAADLYEGLCLIHERNVTDGIPKVLAAYTSMSSQPQKTSSSAAGLAALRQQMSNNQGGPPSKPDGGNSDDELFFKLAIETLK